MQIQIVRLTVRSAAHEGAAKARLMGQRSARNLHVTSLIVSIHLENSRRKARASSRMPGVESHFRRTNPENH